MQMDITIDEQGLDNIGLTDHWQDIRDDVHSQARAEWPTADITTRVGQSAQLVVVYGETPDGMYEPQIEERVREMIDTALNRCIA